jgi:trigger factor
MGMLPAEERTFELTYPNDFDEESRRGKRATYTVKLSSISAKRLPELNDEFATQAAGVATLEDMRKVVRMRMEADAARMSDEIAEQRLLDKIVKGSEIHFPNALVQEEVQDKLRQLSEEIAQNRLTYSQYLAQMGRSAEQHQAQLASLSHAQIQVLLALREIAGKENLQTSNESVEAEFDRLLNEGVIDDTQYEEYRRDQRRRLQVANALVQQTLHDFLFANNTINEVAAPDGPDEEAIKAIAESSDDPVAGAAADPGTAGY